MKTYKEQQEEKGLVFKPLSLHGTSISYMVYFKRIADAKLQGKNPNDVDYYKVAGIWITKEEDERRKNQDKRFNILFGIFCITCSVVILFFTLFSVFYL